MCSTSVIVCKLVLFILYQSAKNPWKGALLRPHFRSGINIWEGQGGSFHCSVALQMWLKPSLLQSAWCCLDKINRIFGFNQASANGVVTVEPCCSSGSPDACCSGQHVSNISFIVQGWPSRCCVVLVLNDHYVPVVKMSISHISSPPHKGHVCGQHYYYVNDRWWQPRLWTLDLCRWLGCLHVSRKNYMHIHLLKCNYFSRLIRREPKWLVKETT